MALISELPSISVIIPTYNRSNYVIKTLESFINQNYPKDKYEIIVVDNNSSDNTAAIINDFIAKNKNNIKYILETRRGNHHARNNAASIASNEILYFCDDDIIADRMLLKEIVRPFIIDQKVGTATGRVLPKWETPPPKWIERYCNNRFLSLLDPPEDFLISNNINFLFSCHQAIRKNVFIKAGGFNPETFGNKYLGDGETGLNIKISKLGYKFAFNGASVTYHAMSSNRYTQNYLNKRLENAGYAKAYTDFRKNKHYSLLQFCFMTFEVSFIYMPLIFMAIFFNFIKYKDINVIRFIIAQGYFYKSYLQYLSWLYFSSEWRKFALKSDWMGKEDDYRDIIEKHLNLTNAN